MTRGVKKSKPIAIFDIDGTIFRSSLLIELNALLVREGIFPATDVQRVSAVHKKWLNRHGSYSDYINTIVSLYMRDLRGTKPADIRRISRKLITQQKHRVYVFSRDLISKLRRSHRLIIVSFSPQEVVDAFSAYYHFDVAVGIDYEVHRGRYTGAIASTSVFDKETILKRLIREHGLSLRGSVGVGDTEYDTAFLKMVDHPIAFNPNKLLYNAARRNHWQIVVERKDVIYSF